ncbi:hypothetical protein Tco_0580806 [Tanacetum coccineum]
MWYIKQGFNRFRGPYSFYGKNLNCNKASWVNWKAVIAPKDKGGLGVPSLYALNRGLMFKWLWRFCTQDRSLWFRVIKAIHGEEGNMGVTLQNGYSSCWMNIVNEARVLASKGIDIIKYIRFKLGNGEAARFWEDRWLALEGDLIQTSFIPSPVCSGYSINIETVAMKFTTRQIIKPVRSVFFLFRKAREGGAEQAPFEALNALAQGVRLTPKQKVAWSLTSSVNDLSASIRHLRR